jgi:hypothetical protein
VGVGVVTGAYAARIVVYSVTSRKGQSPNSVVALERSHLVSIERLIKDHSRQVAAYRIIRCLEFRELYTKLLSRSHWWWWPPTQEEGRGGGGGGKKLGIWMGSWVCYS